ncbi:putative alanine aminotransferase [Aspergillus japonicus CBS 114.51]|uniref:Glutamate pyruvate transaminase n=2 Tax=Aspergillus TaxID=5052 RepID=A0A2V5GSH1_ASPV1|nr:putative alanine aminotransferase [Aspergillus japonicus CBS 114.51]PYI14209.1 putative alanine aminotransferase [Aspergillus violaceofuscus CBS 115571]RAH79294.1 putative alanine aminotransferase [Aspergillus japonicus CBS 114.51]
MQTQTTLAHTTRRTLTAVSSRRLTLDNINPHVKAAKYAVRGEIATKAEEYRVRLAQGDKSLPFESVIFANIGNPQQLDQKPITFFRQVLSLLENPVLLENPELLRTNFGYPQDVIDRAKVLLADVQSVGAYSHSQGAPVIRDSVAKFIEQRDGFPANSQDLYLTAGASSGVSTILNIICDGPSAGVLVPIPQYPLYTATLSLLDAQCVPYLLDEQKAWGTDVNAIKENLSKAKAAGTDVRAIVVINPGNPTGASLSAEDIKSVLDVAAEERLVVIADEVYQTNVFTGEFISFKKRLRQLQQEVPGKYDNVELVSLHSVSKGMVGECGHRGGYFELVGFDPEVAAQIYKYVSIMLCPPVIGQCLVELMVNPPTEGEPSYELYQKEYNGIKDGLRSRAMALYEAFQNMEGVECQEPQGAMYLFPTINLPPKAIEAAAEEKRAADEFYCLQLLDATGICVVPGSGFGQKENTLHFRTTFLAPGTDWAQRIVKFHSEFMAKYK